MARSPAIMWCPSCKAEHGCRSISPSEFGETSGYNARVVRGINCYKRYRRCEECGHDFETAEVDFNWLNKLISEHGNLEEIYMKLMNVMKGIDTLNIDLSELRNAVTAHEARKALIKKWEETGMI